VTPSSEFGIKQVSEIVKAQIAEQGEEQPLTEGNFFNINDLLWMVPWRQYGFNYCGVYLIGPNNRWPLKIGISECAYKRIDALQTAHWQRINCHGYWLCENKKAAALVERKAHELLKEGSRHLMGEWFDIDLKKAAEIVVFAADAVGVEIVADIPKIDKFRKVFAYLEIAYPRWNDFQEARPSALDLVDLRWAMNRGGGKC
jgi:hypothetical protein